MTTTALNTLHHSAAPAAHGASFWTRLWAALEAQGERRAAAALRRQALLQDITDPALRRFMQTH